MSIQKFSPKLAIQLGKLSKQTYAQYEAHKSGKSWNIQDGYHLQETLFAIHEGNRVPIGFVATEGSDTFVAWRGTDNIEEWIEDGKADQVACSFLKDGEKVELGFHELYTTAKEGHPSPQEVVRGYMESHPEVERLLVTGHSLGAALAVLNVLDIQVTTGRAPIAYTLAGPRVGDPAFADTFDDRIETCWRVVNSHDEVPKVPPTSCPPLWPRSHYQHVNREYRITFGNWWNLPEDHSLDNYLKCLEGAKGRPDQGLTRG